MSYRTDKRHRTQETGKVDRSILVLASRLQKFVSTGLSTKKDLKAIDAHLTQFLLKEARKALESLVQLESQIPKTASQEGFGPICASLSAWIAHLVSKEIVGYSDIAATKGESALLEQVVDLDSDLATMMIEVNACLSGCIAKSSYEIPDTREITREVEEILDLYNSREKLLLKVSGR